MLFLDWSLNAVMYGIWHMVEKIKSAYTEKRSKPIGHNQNLESSFHYWNVNQENGKQSVLYIKTIYNAREIQFDNGEKNSKAFWLKMKGTKNKKEMDGYLQQTIRMKGEWQRKTVSQQFVHTKLLCLLPEGTSNSPIFLPGENNKIVKNKLYQSIPKLYRRQLYDS